MHDMEYELLTAAYIPEINVKDLEERLMEGEGAGTLAEYCHGCQWTDGGKVAEEGDSTLSADSSLMDTPSPSGSSHSPTPPSIRKPTSTLGSPLHAGAVGLRLAQQSRAARYKNAPLPYRQMCLQEVEVCNQNSSTAGHWQMISEHGCDDSPSDCHLISEDGEKEEGWADEEMADDDEESGEQVAESGNEYFTITDTVDVEEVVAHLSRERLSAPHNDGSLVEESGRHSDQEVGQLVMEGHKTDCRCGLLHWVEKGRVGFAPFQGFRRLTASGHSSLSLSPEADEDDDSLEAVADKSVCEGLLMHLEQPDDKSLSYLTADHGDDGQPEEEWPMLDEEGDGQRVTAMAEMPSPGYGAEVEPADGMEEDAILLANEGDSGKGLLPQRVEQQTWTASDEEAWGRGRVRQWEAVVEEGPQADAAAAEGPAVSVGQLVHSVMGPEVSKRREQSSDSASGRLPLADGTMVHTDHAKADTAPPPSHFAQMAMLLTSTSSARVAQATLLPPPQVSQPMEAFVAQEAPMEEEVALVGRMATCAALEALKEQDNNAGKKEQRGREEREKAGKTVGAPQQRAKGQKRKGPPTKKAKCSSRSPSPEIPLPKATAAAAAAAAPLSAAMAHQSLPAPEAAVELVGKRVAAVQGQQPTVALAATKAQPKKVVIRAIDKADVEAFVKDNRADLVTHHSLLGHAELFYDKKNKAKLDFRRQVLDKMPQQILHEIMALMPKKCLETDEKGLMRLKAGMFSAQDAKFRAALQLYQSRVRTGQYDTEVRAAYVQYALNTLDPWKLKNFEPVYGMVMDPSYVTGTLHHLLQAKSAQIAEDSQVREGESTETT